MTVTLLHGDKFMETCNIPYRYCRGGGISRLHTDMRVQVVWSYDKYIYIKI